MTESLIVRDSKAVWHPFTQTALEPAPLAIQSATGVYLQAYDGTRYIDAISSWWVALHGHAHPQLTERIQTQLQTLHHVVFAGCTHEPAVELAERLLAMLPASHEKVFFTDNGSSAVEAGLKMALQFCQQTGKPERKRFISLENGYHGDTLGAMSVGSRSFFNAPFHSHLFETGQIPAPYVSEAESVQALEQELSAGDVAAFIYEPLVQGAGGMRTYPAAHLDELLRVCRAYDVLCIADEVFTGFWKTGSCFASDQATLQPDIMVLSKALTGGSLPLAALSATGEIFEAFVAPERSKMFLHGHTFTANPLACSAACASLELMGEEDFHERRVRVERQQAGFAERMAAHPNVRAVRHCGLLAMCDVAVAGESGYEQPVRDEIFRFCLERGVFLRPLGNTVYILPPVIISDEELAHVHAVLTLYLDQRG